MTELTALLAELERLRVRLTLDGAMLRVAAPKGAVTPALAEEMKARKNELIAHLRRESLPADRRAAAEAEDDGGVRVAPGQRRILSVLRTREADAAFHVPTVFRLDGPLDREALRASLTDLARRHDALRSAFTEAGGRSFVRVTDPIDVPLPIDDLAPDLDGLDDAERDRMIAERASAEVRRAFDLVRGPPWRARLFALGPRAHVLVLTMHHVVFDGRSKPVFLDELAECYRARVEGRAPSLPPAPPFADYASWQRRVAHDADASGHIDYWRQTFAGLAEPTELPVDRPRRARTAGSARHRQFDLDAPTAEGLRALARREQASPYIVLLAAFVALLHVRSGQRDLVVCSPFASRERAGFERMIGYLNTLVPLRVTVDPIEAFDDLVRRVRRLVFGAFERQQVPLQRIAELPELARIPFARALFAWQDDSTRRLDLPGLVCTPLLVRKDASDFDLAVYAEGTREGGMGAIVEYDGDLFDEATIDALIGDYRRLLDAVARDPHRTLDGLPAGGPTWKDAEVRLEAHPQVDAAVVGRRPGHAGGIAWLVLDEDAPPTAEALRAWLASSLPHALVPTALVPIDRMPRRADGSIDLDALPSPPSLKRRPGTAPRTPLEQQLAEIWQRVLWLDLPVGIDEDFTDLGGHSLLSAQLIVEVEAAIGRPLPSTALARMHTIAAMAGAIEADAADSGATTPAAGGASPHLAPDILHGLRLFVSSWAGTRARPESLVIGHHVDGKRLPVFWCMQRQQELAQLARYLDPDRPVWGMRNGHKVMERNEENHERLAAHYVDEIVALRPEGPLVIGGNCGATRVSFAIARQLAARGRTPALLVMHEKFIARAYDGPVALMFGRESNRNPYATYVHPETGWRKFLGGPLTFDFVRGEHTEFFVEPNIQVLVEALERRMREVESGVAPADALAPASGPLDRLPEAAYRATLVPALPPVLRAGERVRIDVEVTNASPVTWAPFARSGIALVNRWFDEAGALATWLDGWTALPAELAPGARTHLALEIVVPARPGRYRLDVDLVDEGITTFEFMGSSVASRAVEVLPGVGGTGDYNPAPLRAPASG